VTEPDAGAAPQARRDGGPFLTPYEMAFGEAGFENRVFPRIQAEADEHGDDPTLRERFGFLTLASDAAREMVPPEASHEAMEEYRALLYHAFNFWRFGRRMYVLDAAVARYLVEAAPALAGWELSLPAPSVYVRLPPNLFWASIATDVPPEPVDGFFATVADGVRKARSVPSWPTRWSGSVRRPWPASPRPGCGWRTPAPSPRAAGPPGCCGPGSAATPRSWSAWPPPSPPPARRPACGPRTAPCTRT